MSSRTTSIKRGGSKSKILPLEPESGSQKSEGTVSLATRRSSSKSRLLKQGSNHEVRAASPGTLDDDFPDNVSLTLVEHELASGLDSPSKEVRNVDLHGKLEPDAPSMEWDNKNGNSCKTEPPVIADVDPVVLEEPPVAVELPILEFLPAVTPQPSPQKVAPPKEAVPLPALSAAHTQSTKVTPTPSARVPAADGKHRSKSMLVTSTTSSSTSLSVDTTDRKPSPSEKFRSFMKSFTPSRNLEDVDENELGNFSSDGVSMKASSSSSRKMPMTPEEEAKRASDLKLRIARVQEEQSKFRQNQKKNLRASFAAASPTSFREQSNLAKEKEKIKKLKLNKNGTAPSFNTSSILAGLKKTEFRATLEVGASFLKTTRRLSEDLFNENSIPITHGNNPLDHHIHKDAAEHHRTVTFHGEGYMSDEDWRITNRLKNKRQMKSLDAKSAASSQQNLEEVIEASLREQSAKSIPVDDCSDTPDVPLAYLQSSTLVEKRFGWETKDHSIAPGAVMNRNKSWSALRSAVHGAGAFNIVAAAAAASTPSAEEDQSGRLRSPLRLMPDPPASAPVIVLEATPVTDFVAKIVHGSQHRSLSLSEDEASVSSAERAKLPTFVISKHVPQRKSPEKMLSPLQASMRPSKTVIAKEEMKNAKMLANTKEFHDRYHGLIFHDSSRNLTWQDTEDLILGTGRHHQNNVLNTRSDMRSAGKTMNMFRPWSAARQEDVIDQFLHQHPMSSQPGSRGGSQPSSTKNSPEKPGSPTQNMLNALSLRDSYSPTSDRGGDSHSASKRKPEMSGTGSVTSKGSSTGKGVKSSASQGSVTFGAVVFNSGKTSAHVHLNDHHSDAGSVFTMNSHLQGSRASTMTKRAPLLINLVKNLPTS